MNYFKRAQIIGKTGSILILLTLPLSVMLSSCAETKTAQCQKIILITKKIAEESANNRDSTDPEKILTVAKAFEEAGQQVQALNLKDNQLRTYQQELANIYDGNAEATRNIINAIKSKDILTAKLAQDQVRQIGKKEQLLITQMNQYCQDN
jgi:tricorn protease-like protein